MSERARPEAVGTSLENSPFFMPFLVLLASFAIALGVGVSHAQEKFANLAALIAKGGGKLSSDDAEEILLGARVTMFLPSGAVASVEYKADGSFSGEGGNAHGRTGVFGKWNFENHLGKLCSEIHFSGGRIPTQTHCYYVFKLGNRLFLSYNIDKNSEVVPFENR